MFILEFTEALESWQISFLAILSYDYDQSIGSSNVEEIYSYTSALCSFLHDFCEISVFQIGLELVAATSLRSNPKTVMPACKLNLMWNSFSWPYNEQVFVSCKFVGLDLT